MPLLLAFFLLYIDAGEVSFDYYARSAYSLSVIVVGRSMPRRRMTAMVAEDFGHGFAMPAAGGNAALIEAANDLPLSRASLRGAVPRMPLVYWRWRRCWLFAAFAAASACRARAWSDERMSTGSVPMLHLCSMPLCLEANILHAYFRCFFITIRRPQPCDSQYCLSPLYLLHFKRWLYHLVNADFRLTTPRI